MVQFHLLLVLLLFTAEAEVVLLGVPEVLAELPVLEAVVLGVDLMLAALLVQPILAVEAVAVVITQVAPQDQVAAVAAVL
jgi:hypothetical protein